MVFQNISSIFGSYTALILILIFIAFVFAVRRVMKILFHAVWIAFVSALFPLFANAILDTTFPIDLETFVVFITLGLGLYAIWIIARFIYFLTGVAEKILMGVSFPFRAAKKGHEEKEKRNMEDYYKKKVREEKEIAREEKELKKQKQKEEKRHKEDEKYAKYGGDNDDDEDEEDDEEDEK